MRLRHEVIAMESTRRKGDYGFGAFLLYLPASPTDKMGKRGLRAYAVADRVAC